MTGWLTAPVEELFGADATAEEAYDLLTVDVPPSSWTAALETARSVLGCTYFDWLSAVDEPGTGFRVSAHVVALAPVRRLLVRTTVPHDAPVLPSAVGVYAGAAWHERETHEMFGVAFEGHPGLTPLLLPDGFEGHPLRKDFVLAARVAKAWPGAKEPGESEHGGPKRRQMLPPGVPDPNEWGPLKGQLPAAPARPARGAARAAAAGDRPVRRTRTASEGSASQTGAAAAAAAGAEAATGQAGAATPRRSRSVSEGSASQRGTTAGAAPVEGAQAEGVQAAQAEGAPAGGTQAGGAPAAGAQAEGAEAPAAQAPAARGPRRVRSASEGSASQREERQGADASAKRPDTAAAAEREATAAAGRSAPGRSADAPWHHARPAFDEPDDASAQKKPAATAPGSEPRAAESPAADSREPEGTEPAEPPEPAEPAQPAESAEPAEPAERTQNTGSPDDPTKPQSPADPESPAPTHTDDRPGGPQ
ncbi:NADH-quinone oxidoreductase subunit C [Streptomyces jeddahensis]|uniref:NADH-quinone oxidoreductase chain 5 n=1 Tax=Streptomyces jeddahensis TaxID=1716141 RepID=A0A177HMC1_9ACTN|nr:NADH-quinone oxidoreductase subunit C [Streptomyces jeddahensis]OAH11567.1 NADH-quinone oxidoreductase chain 5 [Streptomyces jeddahensis]